MGKEQENGFEAALRERYSISKNAHNEDIKEAIMKLFDEPVTAIDAAELVLGRQIGERDSHIIDVALSHLTAERKFEKLVAQRNHEKFVSKLLKDGKK
jgi:hypothetical protein